MKREKPHAERTYLNNLNVRNARQIIGNAECVQAIRKGAKLKDVFNTSKNSLYHARRLNDMITAMENNDYEAAKAGARHNGFYQQWKNKRAPEVEKSIRTLREQINIHQDKIANPWKYIDRNTTQRHAETLVKSYWPKEISNFEQQINILKGILGERK